MTMWALGSLVYVVAIFHRTSLGVASGIAQERFKIGPAELSMFTVQQLIAAAAMQLPAGLLVDKFGARRVLTVALFLMATGQTIFAIVHSFPLGLTARVLVGLGDAMTFVSVLRLTTSWCSETRIALLVQLTTVLGMGGNVISTAPLGMLLEELGWTPTFLSAALFTATLGCLVFGAMRDAPDDAVRVPATIGRTPIRLRGLFDDVRSVWRIRGTMLGFWMHFTSTFSFAGFSLLWGFPFLTRGEGMSAAAAGNVLMLLVITNMVAGPIYGYVASARGSSRVRVNVTTFAVVAVLWVTVLGWPGPAPHLLVALLAMVLGMCGPASVLGVDVARTSSPPNRVATAAAMVTAGGYAGTLVAVSVVGIVLSVADRAGVAEPAAFTMAFAAQWSLFLLGALQILRYNRDNLSQAE